jgi:hypothetical protein
MLYTNVLYIELSYKNICLYGRLMPVTAYCTAYTQEFSAWLQSGQLLQPTLPVLAL